VAAVPIASQTSIKEKKTAKEIKEERERRKECDLSMALELFVGPWPLFFHFLMFYTVGRTPWAARRKAAIYKDNTNADLQVRVSSGIRIHDFSVRADEDISNLRLHGYCDLRSET
jgi:hypothetical protein